MIAVGFRPRNSPTNQPGQKLSGLQPSGAIRAHGEISAKLCGQWSLEFLPWEPRLDP